MSDTSSSVFRSAPSADTSSESSYAPSDDGSRPVSGSSDTSFLSYEKATGKPYAAVHFGLSDLWGRGAETAFKQEIPAIDKFIREKVVSGSIADDTKSVQKYIKQLEKDAKLDSYEGGERKIAKLYAYINFLRTVDGTR